MPIAPFITGGALDLMIGTNPNADPDRTSPVEGDCRLVITKKSGKTWAMLYRAVVAGTPETEKVARCSSGNGPSRIHGQGDAGFWTTYGGTALGNRFEWPCGGNPEDQRSSGGKASSRVKG